MLLAAGCVRVESAPPREPPVIGATQGEVVNVEPATPSTTLPTHDSVATTDSPAVKTPAAAKTPAVAESPSVAQAPSVAKAPSKVPASPAPTEQPRKQESAAPGPGKQEAPPPLDLASLEQRLRDTKAIGLFTKISLKNQVDDLLTQFRAFHQGRAGSVLTELRERYNLLLLKVMTLLQGSDPVLARAIATSREAIWGILTDPVKFATL